MMSKAELLEALSTTYGFPIPLIFAQFIHCNLELRQKPEYRHIFSDDHDFIAFSIWGYASKLLFTTCDSGRYFHTPPELFPFGSPRIDGIHYGYVVHAPELALRDYPIGEFAPMDETGVTLIGNTAEEALECLLSEALEIYEPEAVKRSFIIELAQTLNLHPTSEKIRQNYTTPIKPYTPSGWYFEPSSDGVGVLAPSQFWSPNTPTLETWSFDTPNQHGRPAQFVDRAITEVERSFYDEYPATALFILRELYWRDPDLKLLETIAPLWQRAYDELDRSHLAEIVQQHLIEQQTRQNEWRMQEIENSTSVQLVGYAVDGDEFAEFEISDEDENF
jgi:hypothetical protein